MTGEVACNGIGHTGHHWAGGIHYEVACTKLEARLAAKGQRITVAAASLDGALHPHNTACGSIGFQRRDRRGVAGEEVSEEMIVPVENNDAVVAKAKASQLCRGEDGESVSSTDNGVFDDGVPPWVMALEEGVIVGSSLAVGEGIVDRVVRQEGKVVRSVAGGQA